MENGNHRRVAQSVQPLVNHCINTLTIGWHCQMLGNMAGKSKVSPLVKVSDVLIEGNRIDRPFNKPGAKESTALASAVDSEEHGEGESDDVRARARRRSGLRLARHHPLGQPSYSGRRRGGAAIPCSSGRGAKG